jgi:hypothetical protein
MPSAILLDNLPSARGSECNSPLESRKVRLRGLGGRAVCGVSGTCASATGDYQG